MYRNGSEFLVKWVELARSGRAIISVGLRVEPDKRNGDS